MIAVHVAQLLKNPPGATRDVTFSVDPAELELGVDFVEPVVGQAHLTRTSRGILSDLRYQTSVELACGRCLAPVVAKVEGSSRDEYVPLVDVNTGLLLEEQPEPDELTISEKHVLDLSEVIRQDLLTQLPLQPLCSPDCLGLCPECGAERRQHADACGHAEDSSSPFAGLAELLKRDTPREGSS